MGDRAVLVFEANGKPMPYAVYHHWSGGEGVVEAVARTVARMGSRIDDTDYVAARYLQEVMKDDDGVTGFGIMSGPSDEDWGSGCKQYSHGDAGVAVLNERGELRWLEGTGYGGRHQA